MGGMLPVSILRGVKWRVGQPLVPNVTDRYGFGNASWQHRPTGVRATSFGRRCGKVSSTLLTGHWSSELAGDPCPPTP